MAAVVLNYRTAEDTYLAASSLMASNRRPDHLIVVDNDVADECRRVLFAMHHGPCFPGALEHGFSGAGRRQRAERSYQSCLRHKEVLPVKPVIKRLSR
jgi:hypothetical protein